MGASRKQMTHLEIVALAEKLRAVCSTVNGMAKYAEGWSDERVSSEFPDLKPSNVSSLRNTMFGTLYVPQKAKMEDLLARLELLEEWAAKRPVEPYLKIS